MFKEAELLDRLVRRLRSKEIGIELVLETSNKQKKPGDDDVDFWVELFVVDCHSVLHLYHVGNQQFIVLFGRHFQNVKEFLVLSREVSHWRNLSHVVLEEVLSQVVLINPPWEYLIFQMLLLGLLQVVRVQNMLEFVFSLFKSISVSNGQAFVIVFVSGPLILKPLCKVNLLQTMNLADVVIELWEVLFCNEVLDQRIVNQSLIELLAVQWLFIECSCLHPELFLVDELEDVFLCLPPHEVCHVSALFLSSFIINKQLW